VASPTDPNILGATAIINQQLAEWGLTSLQADAKRILLQGLNADAVIAQLEDTKAFKDRFYYNEQRRKAGLSVLSPADAIATENQMKQILRQYGMPAGFFDSPKDVGDLIAKNVSATELANRAQLASDKWMTAPAETQTWWKQHYGATDGDAIAAILNPDKALPLIQAKLNSAALGGAAERQGLGLGTARAEQLTALGVTDAQAQAGFGQVAAGLAGDASIATRFGSQFTQTEEENAALLKDAGALQKKQTLNASETALFGGRAGTNTAGVSGATGGR
jgi:hypothetical protein